MPEIRVIDQLRELEPEIRQSGVRRLVLFGPEARGESKVGSEVHLLLELDPPLTFEHYLQVRDLLVYSLGKPVELVMEHPDNPLLREYIGNDAVVIIV